MFQGFEPVTVCDQFVFLVLIKLESEVFRKLLFIALYRLIKSLGRYTVKGSKITINNDTVLADQKNDFFDKFDWDNFRPPDLYGNVIDTLFISNNGCDTLRVTDIAIGSSHFSVDTNVFNVPPDENIEVYGCMDEEALNYNPDATIDDGSCEYPLTVISP